jgi:glycosyltransferase involved in cell wall biosynthesis
MLRAYSDRVKSEFDISDKLLLQQNICGLKCLISGINVRKIFVNSRAAKDIILADSPEFEDKIDILFHPVFNSSPRAPTTDKTAAPITIGTFGVPGPAKKTSLILESFRLLRDRIPGAQLVIAGYDASRFELEDWAKECADIRIHSSVSMAELEELMAGVDVAIQLRSRNLGESSGPVSQLLGLGKATIVSPVGSFNEYGQAVIYAPLNPSPESLSQLIVDVIEKRIHIPQGAIERYVTDHSVARFCSQLACAIGRRQMLSVTQQRT